MKIKDALVNLHLKAIVGVGTFTTWGFADHKTKGLGGHTDGTGHLQLLKQSLVLKVGANLLNSGNLGRGKGDADAVDGSLFFGGGVLNGRS